MARFWSPGTDVGLNTRCSEGPSIEYCQGELDLQEGRLVLAVKHLKYKKGKFTFVLLATWLVLKQQLKQQYTQDAASNSILNACLHQQSTSAESDYIITNQGIAVINNSVILIIPLL